jgi:hypothetical protein
MASKSTPTCGRTASGETWKSNGITIVSLLICFDGLSVQPATIPFYKSLQQSVLSSEIPKIVIFTHTPYIGITLVYIHELVGRARLG